jgi:hypothetical protein
MSQVNADRSTSADESLSGKQVHELPEHQAHELSGEPVQEQPTQSELKVEDSVRRGNYKRLLHQQKMQRKALNNCEPLLGIDYKRLALGGYPDNESLEFARRQRDLWISVSMMLFLAFMLGLVGILNAVIAGIALGGCVFTVILQFPQIRRQITTAPTYQELIQKRKEVCEQALRYIQQLEGPSGFVHYFDYLIEFNPALRHRNFIKLMQLSQKGQIVDVVNTPVRIRIYRQMLLDADAAYERLQAACVELEQQLATEYADLMDEPVKNAIATEIDQSADLAVSTATPSPVDPQA